MAPLAALDIARQIASVLTAVHAAGIVHRDLKPDNVMIADGDGVSGGVKVLDFGVAKLTNEVPTGNSKLTRYGVMIGTPEYMAPEQAGGEGVDHRADLYALGVILYEMLAGHPPFAADDRIGIIGKHFVEPPPPLPTSIPEKTNAIVLSLLEKDADQRIQTAAELVERIDDARAEIEAPPSVSNNEPVAVDGATLDGRSLPPPRRRRALFPLLAAALVLAIASAAAIAHKIGFDPTKAAAANFGLEPPVPESSAPAEPAASANAAPAPSADPAPAPSAEPAPAASVAAAPPASAEPPAPAKSAEEQAGDSETVDENEPEVTAAPNGAPQVQPGAKPGVAHKTLTAPKHKRRYIIRRRIIRRTIITRR
jgi:serine/threonine-protein kinase